MRMNVANVKQISFNMHTIVRFYDRQLIIGVLSNSRLIYSDFFYI